MNEGSAFAREHAGAVLALRNRVVPMLRAAMLIEQHVVVICHIAGREICGRVVSRYSFTTTPSFSSIPLFAVAL